MRQPRDDREATIAMQDEVIVGLSLPYPYSARGCRARTRMPNRWYTEFVRFGDGVDLSASGSLLLVSERTWECNSYRKEYRMQVITPRDSLSLDEEFS